MALEGDHIVQSRSIRRIPTPLAREIPPRSRKSARRPAFVAELRTMPPNFATVARSAMPTIRPSTDLPRASAPSYPDNPVLARIWRGPWIESQHRGAWVLVDASGTVVDGAGHADAPIFARSSIKSLQALPLLESGAADRFGYDEAEIALALASHSGEPCHTEGVARILARLGLSASDLQCGAEPARDPATSAAMARRGEAPTSLHNNCSGKHAGFLALARHLGEDPARYLDPASEVQRRVREAVESMSSARPGELTVAVDGCSAPTFRLPLARLATAIARVANPSGLASERRAACERMTAAAERHPVMIAGSHKRLCTDLARVAGRRIFPKIGGEAVYLVGVRGGDRGLAVKIDDGGSRALNAVVPELLRRFGFLSADEHEALAAWRAPLRNWAGLEVGRVEVTA
jgi:L-asparaginase II